MIISDRLNKIDVNNRISFIQKNELLFFVNQEVEHLCISKAVKSEVFFMTHNNHQHSDYHQS